MNGGAPGPVRVAAVGYLNARPLVADLEADPAFEVALGPPSVVAARLAAGDADLGLTPVVEAARLGLVIVSDACVAAFGAVDSVLLFLRRAPAAVRRVALDAASRTSRELARWYLRRCGADVAAVDASPAEALADPHLDAVLAIGDDAMELRRSGAPSVDLAEAWAKATGLPFVFAGWAARPGLLEGRPELAARLEAARDRGVAAAAALAAAADDRLGDAAERAVYLGKRLRYVLGPDERRGLDRFLAEALLPPLRRSDPRCST